MKTRTQRRYEVEDRTKARPPVMDAGKWVLWEVRTSPFPHRSYCGAFATKKEAEAARRKLKATP